MSGIITQLFMFLVIWWLTLFVVLPWGVRRTEAQEEGHDPGAPANPMLLKKALITTGIALAIWGTAFVVFHVLGFSLLDLLDITRL
jgi:predicted secreted protein